MDNHLKHFAILLSILLLSSTVPNSILIQSYSQTPPDIPSQQIIEMHITEIINGANKVHKEMVPITIGKIPEEERLIRDFELYEPPKIGEELREVINSSDPDELIKIDITLANFPRLSAGYYQLPDDAAKKAFEEKDDRLTEYKQSLLNFLKENNAEEIKSWRSCPCFSVYVPAGLIGELAKRDDVYTMQIPKPFYLQGSNEINPSAVPKIGGELREVIDSSDPDELIEIGITLTNTPRLPSGYYQLSDVERKKAFEERGERLSEFKQDILNFLKENGAEITGNWKDAPALAVNAPVGIVDEIVQRDDVWSVYVLTQTTLQGTIVPVVNLRYVFNLPEKGISLSDQLILVDLTVREIMLLVDSVEDVIDFPEEEIIDAEKVITGLDYLKGIVKLNGSVIFIHDLEEFILLNEKEIKDAIASKSDEAKDV